MKVRVAKVLVYVLVTVALLFMSFLLLYKCIVPAVFNNPKTSSFIEDIAKKALDADVSIKGMKLKTGMVIAFTVDKLTIEKNGKNYLTLSDIDTLFSLHDFYKRTIVVEKMLAKDIYVDAYNLSKLFPTTDKKKEKKSSSIRLDFYNTLLGVKNVTLIYHSPEFKFDLNARHAIFDRTQDRKYLHLDFGLNIEKDGHKIDVSANDKNRIFMENHVAYIKDFPIEIEKSKIIINAFMTNRGKYELEVSAKDFNVKDIADIVNSNLVVANGSQMLESVNDINGTVNFNVEIKKDSFTGNIKLNEVNLKLKPILDMPVKITGGDVIIGEKDIEFKNFAGYYNNKRTNTLSKKL